MQTSPTFSLPGGSTLSGSFMSRTSTIVPTIGTPHEPSRREFLSTGQIVPVGEVSVRP